MKLTVNHSCEDFHSYRSARVKSLFNVDSGANFALNVNLPIEDGAWQIGLIAGPSGSGKSSLGSALWGRGAVYRPRWPKDRPIVDAIAPRGDFDAVTGALASVGLGSVPAWLRPYRVLSMGERFRADLARVISEAPQRVALAFQRAWRRTGGKAVLLSCHYDIIEWLAPDWMLDTAIGEFTRGLLWRRPPIQLDLWQTDWRYWPAFEPHHYLKLPQMVAATCYVGAVGGELVAHVAFATRPGMVEARACRLVIMPEWQGAGIGLRFLNAVCELWRRGENRYGKPMPTLFHTSHPGLAAALRRDPKWTQVSAVLCGADKVRCAQSLAASAERAGRRSAGSGFGGHFRAVQGFRYLCQQS